MSTITRGNAAEAAVLFALARAGILAYLPFGEGSPFDLAALTPSGDLVRIQVKSGRVRNGCIEFNTCTTDHGHGRQPYHGRADVIAVHAREIDRVFIIPVDECALYRGYLRLDAPRNNQRLGVRMAEDYAFERWAESLTVTSVAA
ncbi:MAG: hypothetical protein QOJ29_259 [Thermoleophilaceae bacterium]|nr:hypothetical protein [Thermoleophilaceae bacterium]